MWGLFRVRIWVLFFERVFFKYVDRIVVENIVIEVLGEEKRLFVIEILMLVD